MGISFVCVYALRPCQQLLSHVGTSSCLPWLNKYYAEERVSGSRAQYSGSGKSSWGGTVNYGMVKSVTSYASPSVDPSVVI